MVVVAAARDVEAVAGLEGVDTAEFKIVVVGASGNRGGGTAPDGPCFEVVGVDDDDAGLLGGPLYLVLSIIIVLLCKGCVV